MLPEDKTGDINNQLANADSERNGQGHGRGNADQGPKHHEGAFLNTVAVGHDKSGIAEGALQALQHNGLDD